MLRLHGQTDEKGDLFVHIGQPNAKVAMDVTLADPLDAMSQEEWARRFDELTGKVDPSIFERLPQQPLRDPFGE